MVDVDLFFDRLLSPYDNPMSLLQKVPRAAFVETSCP